MGGGVVLSLAFAAGCQGVAIGDHVSFVYLRRSTRITGGYPGTCNPADTRVPAYSADTRVPAYPLGILIPEYTRYVGTRVYSPAPPGIAP